MMELGSHCMSGMNDCVPAAAQPTTAPRGALTAQIPNRRYFTGGPRAHRPKLWFGNPIPENGPGPFSPSDSTLCGRSAVPGPP